MRTVYELTGATVSSTCWPAMRRSSVIALDVLLRSAPAPAQTSPVSASRREMPLSLFLLLAGECFEPLKAWPVYNQKPMLVKLLDHQR